MASSLLHNCKVATMQPQRLPYGLMPDCAIAIDGREIKWVGPESELPREFSDAPSVDLSGTLVTPGLIDCHTHAVFAGNRAREFEVRLGGADYSEIARKGGGILSTMNATRDASEDELVEQSLPRLDALIAEGITTVEIKSGYGLSVESELKMLRAARRLGKLRHVSVVTSWLAAHAVPPEYLGRPDDYIDEVAIPGLVFAHEHGLVDAVDGFCENIAFDTAQISRLFDQAKRLGIPVKLHSEQLSNMGGTKLAAGFDALSADHLEYLDIEGVEAMAASGTVAVLLPGAYYTLRGERMPPVRELRSAGVPVAVASDGNPGSSPMFSILLAMNMACTLFRLTPEEALAGTTRNAALALGLAADRGTIEAGKRADLAVWDVEHPAELSYRIGFNSLKQCMIGGELC